MKAILKPVSLNEKSFSVTLLHKALAALDLPVSKEEAAQDKAGTDTQQKIRTLQARLSVPVNASVLVDEGTVLAIVKALKERGLGVASRSFTVSGVARLRTGEVRKRQKLLAFDLDLRGVAAYRTVKNLAEIQKDGGFEFLGETVSDSLGNYRITFYDWQYGEAERKKADVVVYAFEGQAIIGCSRIVNTEDYSGRGLVRDLVVIITQEEKRTEYELLMGKLNAFLRESKTSLSEIAKSRDQLVFTAGELDVDQSHLNIAADAELLVKEEKQLSHELLYGIGRQNIRLSWPALYKKTEEEVCNALARSADERIIRRFQDRETAAFLETIRGCCAKRMLDDRDTVRKNTLNVMLKNALPEEHQRLSFVNAFRDFKGSDFSKFWNTHLPALPEFKDNPQLISGLLFTQQLTQITGNHQALVNELQVRRGLKSVRQLIDLERADWLDIVKEIGVPDFIEGMDDEERINGYADLMLSLLNAAFPTMRIARMVERNELPIEKIKVVRSISAFLSKNEQFDFAGSRIHDFDNEIKEAAGEDYGEVRSELMKMQRVFQVSTTPEAMKTLMENNLHSAYTIANIPRKSFIRTYGNLLGDESAALAIHQRASHISTRAEMNAAHMMEYSHAAAPAYSLGKSGYEEALCTLESRLPNYSELFGSPDIYECEHCRSVYSPAAYFVELLRFLSFGGINSDGRTPLDRLTERRPDLVHLPLTCENTNTIIPYIDLANEVMEYYTANDSLANFRGYDTGEATAEELRANPQNVNLEAYRILSNNKQGKQAVYPFTLPYHQPLDVIRSYGGHLKVSRYEVMKAMNPQPDATSRRAIGAESLGMSQEEYTILTGQDFGGNADTTAVFEYFGYTTAGALDNLSAVREFLTRSGITYVDLVELVKTRFVNPYQDMLDFLQKLFSYSSGDGRDVYTKPRQIEVGTLALSDRQKIDATLDAYSKATGSRLIFVGLAQWIKDYLGKVRQVITLYERESKCELDTTCLRTMQSIYEGSKASGITAAAWSKIHRFIRLWRKLGWTIHETDLMLAALGEDDITTGTISKLESISLLKSATRLPLNQLAVLWGNIDAYGDKSLYKKLFLNKAVQEIDKAFKADAWGRYLRDETETLADHKSAILAAFRMTEEDLDAVLRVARVIDGGKPRTVDIKSDSLNLQNLSTIYRYVLLSKALKMRVRDLCKLIELFGPSPFSTWDIQQGKYIDISPKDTHEFYKVAASTKAAGFKPSVLEYILLGALSADSSLGLDRDKTLQTAKAICDAFAVIEQDHPELPELLLTTESLTAKLSLTFQPEIVGRLMGIVDGTASFETKTDSNLDIIIPPDLAEKYTYVKGSGRLACRGIMNDKEQNTLKNLDDANNNFQAAVDKLYAAPDTFISDNFNGVFSDLTEAKATLLDHPSQTTPASLDKKLVYIYESFLPVLKSRLRRDAITQHIAALIGLGEEATALLIGKESDALITDLSTKGFSATYFSDANWNTSVLDRVDSTIDFPWGTDAPDPSVPANNFSVRWRAYLAAPASGEYTLVVEVEEPDEAFRLYLDDVPILKKEVGEANTSWEKVITLNAAQMRLLTLEYAETSGNAGIRVSWKTSATAPKTIPASAAYPAAVLDAFADKAAVLYRAAKLILGFRISDAELNHFMQYKADFADINFMAPKAEHWRRVNNYMMLRDGVPQSQAFLTQVFALANISNPLPAVGDLTHALHLATAWDKENLAALVGYFKLDVADFKNEIWLNRLLDVMKIISKTGISVQTIAEWGSAGSGFDKLHSTAQLIRKTLKAKYEEEDWLDLAGNLSNKVRENQKQGLIGYLLMQPAIRKAGVEDADGLFEYFLIDVQMGACMDTSRIVQANAAIQMFVNRCLLNLESDISGGSEKGVSPDAIDNKDRWEWMKNYRVWEANRKVFLYPENWLEPEWRNDRSEFFKELESYLLQNDITERSVEQAFRNYLTSLNEVANLEVCGMYQENDEGGKLKYLHVFARTHNAPYRFFYRRWNEYRKWSAWEKVQLDIRSIEDGENSGVHLIPVVWKERLFLFWPEFMEKQEAPSNDGKSIEEVGTGDSKISDLKPIKHWEVRLAWGEYVDGKWSPKQLSKEFNPAYPDESQDVHIKDFEVKTTIRQDVEHNDELVITLFELNTSPRPEKVIDIFLNFHLADIQSKVTIKSPISISYYPSIDYKPHFMNKKKANAPFALKNNTYLQSSVLHMLLYSHQITDFEAKLAYPFFYHDSYRTYFVRPVCVPRFLKIKHPADYYAFLPGIVDDSRSKIPFEIPDIGPDDYMPKTRAQMLRSVSTPTGAGMSIAKNIEMEMSHVEEAFAGVKKPGYEYLPIGCDMGLEFHTFYHPYSSRYVERLNQGGLSRLMESDTTVLSSDGEPDNGRMFESTYKPNFAHGLVKKPSDFQKPSKTYYKENVCFDPLGSNSLYNWELFFHAPLYIATRLSRNGKCEEAMRWFHYIFDPTTDEEPEAGKELSRYWKMLPFKTTPAESLEDWFRSLSPNTDPTTENAIIGEWRDNPFDPHLVASNRPLAYMKHVVIKYVENLIAWGDSLFRQFTRESVNEALQIYVIANHILGPRPQFVPKRGEIKAESYYSLKGKWDDFSNALVELENIFPYSGESGAASTCTGTNMLGIGAALYFCIPASDKLLEYWDTVADRLFKIRHCQDIDGVERQLALFAPPISPETLIQAVSQGLSLGSILADLSSPPPIYRFPYLMQKANEFCSDVKALGSALLATLEKKDAEELARLRASQETQMLELTTAIRERQVLDAKANKENLLKARETAKFRLQHYIDLLGNESVTVPAEPTIDATLSADSQLPADTSIATIKTDVDESLEDSDESGVKLLTRENEALDKTEDAKDSQIDAGSSQMMSSIFHALPFVASDVKPIGIGLGLSWGGSNLGYVASAVASSYQNDSVEETFEATKASQVAVYIRREQDWTLQANLAAKEIIQIDKQITSADIRIQVAEKELANHRQQIENAKAVEDFLKYKFTKQELYQWMKEQTFAVYKQSYNLAFDMAKKAEKAYRYEMGVETASFIQYGYWDNSKQGLVAGEKLQLALRQMEKSYLEGNRRELELTKNVSLAMLNPLALIELREAGKCYVSLPEELFDLDFQGHYFRRIKSVSLSIPCIAGPFTTVNCSLRLLSNNTRINTSMNSEGNYEHENDEGLWIDDDRFRTSYVPVTSIATSTGQNDAGMFEFNFRDERYLPFEGAGAISDWKIELSTEKEFRQFDYSTISDVILHLKYTARENGGLFKEKAITYIKNVITNAAELVDQPFMRMFSMKHEFPTEWHKFLYPATEGGEQVVSFTIGKERFPFFAQDRDIVVMKIEAFAKCTQAGDYHMVLSCINLDEDTVTSSQITMPQNDSYGGLNKATINANDAGLNLEELDITGKMSLKLKRSAAPDYTSLATKPDEVEDIFLVVHYKLV